MIEKKNTRFMKRISLGLAIAAMLAVIVAIIVGYMRDGGINYLLIAVAAVILSANLMLLRKRKSTSDN